jgi:hypothetical protein
MMLFECALGAVSGGVGEREIRGPSIDVQVRLPPSKRDAA